MVESLVLAFALSVIRLSAPMFIAGMGNMYCERVGVLNLGAEGMMVAGAFAFWRTAVILLGGVGQVQELAKRACDRQQLVIRQIL